MQRYFDCGKHPRALERYTLLDRAAFGYAQRPEGNAKLFPSWTQLQNRHLLTTPCQRVGRSSQVLPVDVDLRTSKKTTRLRNFNKVSGQDEKVIRHQLRAL